MAGITVVYTRYYHSKYGTHGFLWQGRFKLQAVQKENYLISCGRYIERNPLKIGLCVESDDYLYSSARFYTRGIADGITVEDPIYDNFGPNPLSRRNNYRNFVHETNNEEEKLFSGLEAPAGSTAFIERLKRVRGRAIPQGKGKPKRDFFISINCPPR